MRGKNLFFSTEIDAAIQESEMIFVSVNTPTKKWGIGAGLAADLKNWELAARNISKVAKSDKIVIEKSTLPVRTAHSMKRVLNANPNGIKFEILSNPEFLAEGTAVTDLTTPDRCLVGGGSSPAGKAAVERLVDLKKKIYMYTFLFFIIIQYFIFYIIIIIIIIHLFLDIILLLYD